MNELLVCRVTTIPETGRPQYELIARVPIDQPRQGRRVFTSYLREKGLAAREHHYFNRRIGAGLPSYIHNPHNL